MINKITKAINDILHNKGTCIIAIDGRCGSGKSTIAKQLGDRFHCNVIHMDDFFLRPEQRTVERLKLPGGNVDYERFTQEVLIPLSKNADFCYRPFNCKRMQLDEPIEVKLSDVTIVEGSYSCHPNLFRYYDLHVFMDIDKDTQLKRIEEREGPEKLNAFIEKWIPLEEKYFETFDILNKCEISKPRL